MIQSEPDQPATRALGLLDHPIFDVFAEDTQNGVARRFKWARVQHNTHAGRGKRLFQKNNPVPVFVAVKQI